MNKHPARTVSEDPVYLIGQQGIFSGNVSLQGLVIKTLDQADCDVN